MLETSNDIVELKHMPAMDNVNVLKIGDQEQRAGHGLTQPGSSEATHPSRA